MPQSSEDKVAAAAAPPTADRVRDRIYERYVSAHGACAAPVGISDLESRGPYLRRLVRRHFPPDRGAAVVDLGCGHGALMHFVREAGYSNVTGVDRSPEQVSEARRLGVPGVEQGDLVPALLERADASLDVLITFDVIEHLTRDELLSLADEIHRVLKPNGRWIIHTPNGESPFFGRIRYGDLTHEQAFTRTSLEQLVRSSDFSALDCFEDVPVPHGVKSTVRFLLWKTIRSALRLYLAAETGSHERGIFSQNLLAIVWR